MSHHSRIPAVFLTIFYSLSQPIDLYRKFHETESRGSVLSGALVLATHRPSLLNCWPRNSGTLMKHRESGTGLGTHARATPMRMARVQEDELRAARDACSQIYTPLHFVDLNVIRCSTPQFRSHLSTVAATFPPKLTGHLHPTCSRLNYDASSAAEPKHILGITGQLVRHLALAVSRR